MKTINTGRNSWQGERRRKRFTENKLLADSIAKERGGTCLSSPRPKHDYWKWKCSNPEHKVWEAKLIQVQGSVNKTGSWCPRCAGKNVPKEELQDWAKRFGGRLIKRASTTVKESTWWCKHHKEFDRTYNNMKTTGNFCPLCSASLGERKCKAAMEQLFGKKFVKKRFPDLKGIGGKSLEIDLYNEELKLGLEHQGAQHFMKKKFFGEHRYAQVFEHDRRKKAYCAKNGITLIEIRQVGEVTPDAKLKEAIRSALLAQNFQLSPSFDDIFLSLDVAALPSLQEDKWEETKAEAKKRGWKIVSTKYLGSLTIHLFFCEEGHTVEIKPSRLLAGDGCWQCEEKPAVLEDGRLFQSLTAAAKEIGASVSAVSKAILDFGRVNGLRAASIKHRELSALRAAKVTQRTASIAAIFKELPMRPKVGWANGKPVVLGDGRLFDSAYEAARAVGADENVALSASKRPKGKIKDIRIAQITKEQAERFRLNPKLIDDFWLERPLGPRKFMTRRRGILTSLREVFEGAVEASEALQLSLQQVCDAARRGTELIGRQLWYLSQDELCELRDERMKSADLLKLKLAEGHPEKRKPKPLTESQLAKHYGLEPTSIANLKALQAKLKATGRDLTLEDVYALEIGDG